jgi:hypothetical protein
LCPYLVAREAGNVGNLVFSASVGGDGFFQEGRNGEWVEMTIE